MWLHRQLDRVCKSQTYVMNTPSKIGKPEFSSGLWLVLHLAKVCGPSSPELAGKANLTKFDGIQTGMIRWEPTCCWLDKCWKNIDKKYLDKYIDQFRHMYRQISKKNWDRHDPLRALVLLVGYMLKEIWHVFKVHMLHLSKD